MTSGSFDLPVTSTGSVSVPDQNGSKFGGTLGGLAWNAATIVMVSSPSSGTLTIGASNVNYNINTIISGYTGVGTYTLNTGVSRTMTVIATTGALRSWGGSGAASAGTLTVTSATPTRIKGSYNVTLLPQGATVGSLTLTGTFDLGIPQ